MSTDIVTETMMTCIVPADSRPRGMIRTRDMAQGDVRTKMVKGAAALLATKGVEGTSFAEVLAVTDAPRGSIYHHFPGGKSELVHAALDLVSTRALAVMESKRGSSAEAIVEQFLDLWRQLLDYSELTAGCAVVAVTVAGLTMISSTMPVRFFETGRSIWPDSSSPAEWPRALLSSSLS